MSKIDLLIKQIKMQLHDISKINNSYAINNLKVVKLMLENVELYDDMYNFYCGVIDDDLSKSRNT